MVRDVEAVVDGISSNAVPGKGGNRMAAVGFYDLFHDRTELSGGHTCTYLFDGAIKRFPGGFDKLAVVVYFHLDCGCCANPGGSLGGYPGF